MKFYYKYLIVFILFINAKILICVDAFIDASEICIIVSEEDINIAWKEIDQYNPDQQAVIDLVTLASYVSKGLLIVEFSHYVNDQERNVRRQIVKCKKRNGDSEEKLVVCNEQSLLSQEIVNLLWNSLDEYNFENRKHIDDDLYCKLSECVSQGLLEYDGEKTIVDKSEKIIICNYDNNGERKSVIRSILPLFSHEFVDRLWSELDQFSLKCQQEISHDLYWNLMRCVSLGFLQYQVASVISDDSKILYCYTFRYGEEEKSVMCNLFSKGVDIENPFYNKDNFTLDDDNDSDFVCFDGVDDSIKEKVTLPQLSYDIDPAYSSIDEQPIIKLDHHSIGKELNFSQFKNKISFSALYGKNIIMLTPPKYLPTQLSYKDKRKALCFDQNKYDSKITIPYRDKNPYSKNF